MNRWIHPVLAALLGAVLAGCDGAGDVGGGLAEGGIGGTGISRGSVTGFGSIVVNGRHFDVQAGSVTVNGEPSKSQGDLDVGYVVRVDGGFDDGIADSVRFDADVIGPVEGAPSALTGGAGVELTVMQQTVRVTATTVLVGIDAAEKIADGTRVLVSGYRDSADVLVATHLQTAPTATLDDQIVGEVDETHPDEFLINGLRVLSQEEPDVGDRVIVRGDYDPGVQTLTPTSPVEQVEELTVVSSEIELEGLVTEFDPATPRRFTVDGVAVDAGGAEIVDETGAPAADRIARDVEVEVEGAINASRVLIARRVEVELEDNVELQAPLLTAPDGNTVSFFNQGAGAIVTATVVDGTRLRDSSDADDGVFTLDELAAGEWVELDGFEEGDGNVTALQIERIDPEDEVRVEGIVDSVGMDTLEILDVMFGITGETSFEGVDSLAGIEPGDIVEVRWTGSGTTLVFPHPVDEVELEEGTP